MRTGLCSNPPMKLLVFAGSTRQQSFNRRLARIAADLGREAGAEATLLELSELDIPMYNADLEARGTPPDVIRLKEILDAHPAWIICSPEYNGSYTGLLKNTIDWASSPVAGHPVWTDVTRPFAGKVVGRAQRLQRRTGRPALAKPPGAHAGQPGLLAGAAQLRTGARGQRLR